MLKISLKFLAILFMLIAEQITLIAQPIGTQIKTDTSGHISYWNGIDTWIAITPGLPGQSLQFTAGVPSWVNNPNGITTTVVSNISTTSAVSGGNIISDGGEKITAKGVCWSTSPNPTIADNKTINGSGIGSFVSNITGLSLGSTYYVRAYATSNAGTAYGNQISFNTISNLIIWSSDMSNNTQWTVSNAPNANISTQWTRLADTSMASLFWKQYVGSFMGSATPMNGVYYFDGITNLVNTNYGISNSRITNATPIVTTGHTNISLKFYQLYKGFNADSTLLEISSDNINWTTIDVNPTIIANSLTYSWKEFNISPYAGNKAQLWIRFRFFAPASTFSGAQYGGGYGWMIDDVTIKETSN